MIKYKTILSRIVIILILGLGAIAINNLQNQKVVYATQEDIPLSKEEIVQALNGNYTVDYQIEGSYLDILKNIYGSEIHIVNGKFNGWRLQIDDIVKMSNDKYVVNCTYLLKGKGTPPPMVEARLIIELSDDKIVYIINHQHFLSKKWPDGEWKTDMILYRQQKFRKKRMVKVIMEVAQT